MTLGEKIRSARKEKGLTQTELAKRVGVSQRTIASYETDHSTPKTKVLYKKLSEELSVNTNYLLTDDDAFILDAGEEYGSRGKKEAIQLMHELTGLFAGGEMDEEDMDALMSAVQTAYKLAKMKNKKYTPHKYQTGDK